VLCLLFGGFAAIHAASHVPEVNVMADGNNVNGVIVDGTTFVAAKDLAEALGRTVSWNPETRMVTVQSRLDTVLENGYIRVGTTGDYKPFSFWNEETEAYEGHDIDAAHMLAESLGVEVQFVRTTWPTLMQDLLDDKYDIAMGGITRRMSRQKTAQFSHPYILFGKSPLVREEDKDRFTSLEAIDQPGVTIGVNPGGTNEIFVRENISNANIVVHEFNAEIPGMVADGTFDVMFTDSIEAIVYARDDARLHAAFSDDPLTREQFGYLMHQGDPIFANTINFWMEEMVLKGHLDQLWDEWID
jgi:cyclohexadienyl dehydratase